MTITFKNGESFEMTLNEAIEHFEYQGKWNLDKETRCIAILTKEWLKQLKDLSEKGKKC